SRAGRTEFVGYERLESEGVVQGLVLGGDEATEASEGQPIRLLLSRTPFYAEGGGQVGDRGIVRTGEGVVRIDDAVWGPGQAIVHRGVVESGVVRLGEEAHAEVDREAREATARSHTATHIVHWTLR